MEIPGHPNHTWQVRRSRLPALRGWSSPGVPQRAVGRVRACRHLITRARAHKKCCLSATIHTRRHTCRRPCPSTPLPTPQPPTHRLHPSAPLQVMRGKDGKTATAWSLRAAQEILQVRGPELLRACGLQRRYRWWQCEPSPAPRPRLLLPATWRARAPTPPQPYLQPHPSTHRHHLTHEPSSLLPPAGVV